MSEVTNKLTADCEKSIEHFKQELSRARTGRANSSLLESLVVDYYGSKTPLQQLALINAPEPRQLTVQVYDAGAVDAVEKAIQQSGQGLNPARDGNIIRVHIPALTEERRKEIVKGLGKTAEESRVAVRTHRRDANDQIKKMKEANQLTEDDVKREESEVQKITDKFVAEVDSLLAVKEKEILAV